MKTKRFSFLAGVSLATALILSCSSLKDSIGDITSGLSSSNLLQNNKLQNGFMSGATGVPDGNADVIQDVKINGAALSGGSTSITVTSSEELSELYLQIEGDLAGYYKWELEPQDNITTPADAPNFVYFIVLEFNQSLGEDDDDGESQLRFIISGKTINGEIVEKKEEPLEIKNVGSGALQVSLSWDQEDDLDLYVFTPSGEKLYWNNRSSRDGKDSLDVDANLGCRIDNPLINSENIYFQDPLADGEYKVLVRLYQKCAGPRPGARYNVTANVKGRFVNFGGDNQSGKFDDAAEGQGTAVTITTGNNASTQIIGTIKVVNGEFVP
ncbi:MAG: hypothetical protein FWF67_05665 [Fibromonadales bacterium]|nr:hypothetical protein [Fibromonadales bacterium]